MLIIGLGGFFGTIGRYILTKIIQEQASGSFPWATLAVNLIGSFIIGVVFSIAEKNDILSNTWRNFLTIGFCGGFTTFSTFSLENYNLLATNQIGQALLYSAISVLSGVIMIYLGIIVTKQFS